MVKKQDYTEEEMKLSEDGIQARCYAWFVNEHCRIVEGKERQIIYAVPNGGSRNPIEAKKLKATGTVAGVSDLHVIINGQFIFVELKTPKGVLSGVQMEFRDRVKKHGFPYHVVRSLREFQTLVDYYLNKC